MLSQSIIVDKLEESGGVFFCLFSHLESFQGGRTSCIKMGALHGTLKGWGHVPPPVPPSRFPRPCLYITVPFSSSSSANQPYPDKFPTLLAIKSYLTSTSSKEVCLHRTFTVKNVGSIQKVSGNMHSRGTLTCNKG